MFQCSPQGRACSFVPNPDMAKEDNGEGRSSQSMEPRTQKTILGSLFQGAELGPHHGAFCTSRWEPFAVATQGFRTAADQPALLCPFGIGFLVLWSSATSSLIFCPLGLCISDRVLKSPAMIVDSSVYLTLIFCNLNTIHLTIGVFLAGRDLSCLVIPEL